MNANRTQLFSQRLTAVTANYSGANQRSKLKFTSRHVRIAVVGGDVAVSFNGGQDDAQIDVIVKAGENLPFDGLECSKIAVRQFSGTITELRILAYK